MNTKQLIVLWYAGLLAALVLFGSGIDSFNKSPWPSIAAIAIVASLFYWTFRPHPAANKRVVAAFVLTPFLLIAAAIPAALYIADTWFWRAASHKPKTQADDPIVGQTPQGYEVWQMRDGRRYSLTPDGAKLLGPGSIVLRSTRPVPSAPMKVSEVDIFEPKFSAGPFLNVFQGRVRNRSQQSLNGLQLRVLFYHDDTQVDGSDQTIRFNPAIPPGEARSFSTTITGVRLPERWSAKYDVVKIW